MQISNDLYQIQIKKGEIHSPNLMYKFLQLLHCTANCINCHNSVKKIPEQHKFVFIYLISEGLYLYSHILSANSHPSNFKLTNPEVWVVKINKWINKNKITHCTVIMKGKISYSESIFVSSFLLVFGTFSLLCISWQQMYYNLTRSFCSCFIKIDFKLFSKVKN